MTEQTEIRGDKPDQAAPAQPVKYAHTVYEEPDNLKDKQLSITSGNGLFEVFDLKQVTQAIPELTVVYAIDEYEFSAE